MRRNDIVYNKLDRENGAALYGRITRIMPNGMAETVDCGKYIRVQPIHQLVVINDYKGYNNGNHWVRMPSLRKLKQMCAYYDKTIWKRMRDGLYCNQTRFMD